MKHAPVEFEMAARGRARRKALGLTATELGQRMALSCARICQIEANGAGTVDLVRRWAKALDNMDPGELAFGPESQPIRGRDLTDPGTAS